MANEKVQARIEPAPRPAAAPEPEPAPTPRPDAQAVAAAPSEVTAREEAPQPGAWTCLSTWFATTFPHSRNAVLGGICGLVVALLLFSVGLLKTLVIALLVTIGVACGQYADGDPKLVNLVRELMKRR